MAGANTARNSKVNKINDDENLPDFAGFHCVAKPIG
jgi:hypothetical protein